MGEVYVGCSGWSYEDWIGVFYPESIQKKNMLEFYMREFNLVEINSTFYRMPNKYMVLSWKKKAKENFMFTVKIPKEITHKNFLKNSQNTLDEFMKVMEPLLQSIECFLIQLPPKFSQEEHLGNLEEFLDILPEYAKFAVEFRNKSWDEDLSYLKLLKNHNVAYVVMDSPFMKDDVRITADFSYMRFHGRNPKWTYNYLYTEHQLLEWKPKIEEMKEKTKKTLVHFNNHPKGKAIQNARMFKKILGIEEKKPHQPSLDDWF